MPWPFLQNVFPTTRTSGDRATVTPRELFLNVFPKKPTRVERETSAPSIVFEANVLRVMVTRSTKPSCAPTPRAIDCEVREPRVRTRGDNELANGDAVHVHVSASGEVAQRKP